MAYAMMFEENEPENFASSDISANSKGKYFGKTKSAKKLPPEQSIPVTSYAPPKQQGNWRDTNDLVPPSVTEGTTKLLHEE